jgi:hypothetical protein
MRTTNRTMAGTVMGATLVLSAIGCAAGDDTNEDSNKDVEVTAPTGSVATSCYDPNQKNCGGPPVPPPPANCTTSAQCAVGQSCYRVLRNGIWYGICA